MKQELSGFYDFARAVKNDESLPEGGVTYDVFRQSLYIKVEGEWYEIDKEASNGAETSLHEWLIAHLENGKNASEIVPAIADITIDYNMVHHISGDETHCNILGWVTSTSSSAEAVVEVIPIDEYLKNKDYGTF